MVLGGASAGRPLGRRFSRIGHLCGGQRVGEAGQRIRAGGKTGLVRILSMIGLNAETDSTGWQARRRGEIAAACAARRDTSTARPSRLPVSKIRMSEIFSIA